MFIDYFFLKILILLVVIAIICVGFYFVLKMIFDSFKQEEVSVEDTDFHYNQIEEIKKIENEYIQKIEYLNKQKEIMSKKYEDGIFFKKNQELWKKTRDIFEDLNRWKRDRKYPIDENEVDLFLDDVKEVFKELGIELIIPKEGELFDSKSMKVVSTICDQSKQSNQVAQTVKIGYKLRLKNQYRILQEAEVILYKN